MDREQDRVLAAEWIRSTASIGFLLFLKWGMAVAPSPLSPTHSMKPGSKALCPDSFRNQAFVCAVKERWKRGVAGIILSALLDMILYGSWYLICLL
jgi:hypothetical protein